MERRRGSIPAVARELARETFTTFTAPDLRVQPSLKKGDQYEKNSHFW